MTSPTSPDSTFVDPADVVGVLVKTGNILGAKVLNRLNEDMGNVEDMVINVLDGSILYAALTFGGFLGLGEKLYAVPWKALLPRATNSAAKLLPI